ncbi:MAG: type II secretion system protein [Phycisphaeraceae bacterium]|nr:type II secretion system protein [Phycisphaeraceae bacterium]MCW5753242.1 type II secretion system protein [Phycisphaeraceae bacterium]
MTRSRRAFTLVELLIAVAAGILLATAIAAVFASTGRTVSAGNRLSHFNRYAAIIEQQLREDFRAMTRDGFLLIRQEVANQGPTANFAPLRVPLFAAQRDRDRRYRRTDEIVFFTKGRYSTARAPLSPGVVATSSEARIYIGHGARFDAENLVGLQAGAVRYPAYDLGIESHGVNPRTGVIGRLGVPNSTLPLNQYASDWILLRHVTLLTPPQTAHEELPSSSVFHINRGASGFTPANAAVLRDGDRQIALQPAMPSIFRHVNFALRQPAADDFEVPNMRQRSPYTRLNDEPWMLAATGLFDIATTSLAEVRQYVTSMHDGRQPPNVPEPVLPSRLRNGEDVRQFPPRGYFPAVNPQSANGRELLDGMHAWMRNALPADSDGDDFTVNLRGLRMRAERTPPALPDIVAAAPRAGSGVTFARGSLEAADRLNDQLVLTSSMFVPRCSAFIVEWSFNQVDETTGEIIWYGSTELIGSDADGVPTDVRIRRYDSSGPRGLFIDRRTGAFQPVQNAFSHVVNDYLIHGPTPVGAIDARKPVLAYFGYDDPTYRPQSAGDRTALAWPWPELIRVTITLVDPIDPSVEQTYQFVFKVGGEG